MDVIFVSSDGTERRVTAGDEDTVMKLAIANDVEGIVAECRGSCTCATCHVMVDPDWLSRMPPIEEMENDMLDALAHRTDRSRLSCQIRLSEALDGLRLDLPASQY